MPFYNIEHSFPLNNEHKVQLAEKITSLHSRTFTTPSIFVQVKFFQHDASSLNHFVGGKAKDQTTNRIIAFVRSSPGRKKEHFDKLAEDIEKAWYIVLGEAPEDDSEEAAKRFKGRRESSQTEKDAKQLLSIGFVGGLMGREKGFPIPEAGKEGEWVQQYRKEFEQKAEMGDEELKNMLEEIEKRDDLKGWRA